MSVRAAALRDCRSEESDVEKIEPVFTALDVTTRRILLQMMVDASDTDPRLIYNEFGLMALNDSDGEVRRVAVEMLEDSESGYVMNRMIRLAQQDKSLDVRAEATAMAICLLGEFCDLPEEKVTRLRNGINI